MKKFWIAAGAVFAVVVLFCALAGLRGFLSFYGDAAAVGVIGGADGPTSIFVAGKLSFGEFLKNSLVTLLVGAVLLTGIIIWGKRKK